MTTEVQIGAELMQHFAAAFGAAADGVWSAPGRVNLIGEHTDYNSGLCLPIAIPRRTHVAVRRRDDRTVRLASRQLNQVVTVSLDKVGPLRPGGWGAYVAGVLWALEQAGHRLGGVDVLVDGRVPLGSGLSSSAALECSVAVAVVDLFELEGLSGPVGRRALAAACVRAENEIAGAPTGGMDQSAALLATSDTALLLDFDGDHAPQPVPFDLAAHGLQLLVMNTRAAHSLGDGQYGNRRDECVAAAEALGVDSLRHLPLEGLEGRLAVLTDDVLRRRARHVVTEIGRVTQTVDALEADDFARLTDLFDQSHASMRDDFEISCAELDVAVDTARGAGALAARMTGGGFGGSAIAIVENGLLADVSAAALKAFIASSFREPELFAVTADVGATRDL